MSGNPLMRQNSDRYSQNGKILLLNKPSSSGGENSQLQFHYFYFKDISTGVDAEYSVSLQEAKSLNAIRAALENLEDRLEFFHDSVLNGVWSAKGPRAWEGCYYVYEVLVYHPSTLRIEKCIANDPYSRGLSADCSRTLIVNLDSNMLKPQGWDNLSDEKPDIVSFSDISVYEIHVRDFSANDISVHPDLRGKSVSGLIRTLYMDLRSDLLYCGKSVSGFDGFMEA